MGQLVVNDYGRDVKVVALCPAVSDGLCGNEAELGTVQSFLSLPQAAFVIADQ
jgi:hypothetical protein